MEENLTPPGEWDAEAEKVLDDADRALKEKGWCTGHLTSPYDGSHCALGSIGYAKWGEEFDEAVLRGRDGIRTFGNQATGYDMLRSNPSTALACQQLANQIRESRGAGVFIKLDPYNPDLTNAAMSEVMSYNDGLSTIGGSLSGREEIRALLRRGRDKWVALRWARIEATRRLKEKFGKRDDVVPAIKAPRVEHIKAETVEEQAEKAKETV